MKYSEMTEEQIQDAVNFSKICYGERFKENKRTVEPIEMTIEEARAFATSGYSTAYVYPLIPESIKANREFMKYVLENHKAWCCASVLSYASEELRNDPELATLAVKGCGGIGYFAGMGEELRNNKEFLKNLHNKEPDGKYVSYRIKQVSDVGEEVLKDKEFVEWLIGEGVVQLYDVEKIAKNNPEIFQDDNVMVKLLLARKNKVGEEHYYWKGLYNYSAAKDVLEKTGRGDNPQFNKLIESFEKIHEITNSKGIGFIRELKMKLAVRKENSIINSIMNDSTKDREVN